MWDLPRSGIELVSPELADRFCSNAPPGKPPFWCLWKLTVIPLTYVVWFLWAPLARKPSLISESGLRSWIINCPSLSPYSATGCFTFIKWASLTGWALGCPRGHLAPPSVIPWNSSMLIAPNCSYQESNICFSLMLPHLIFTINTRGGLASIPFWEL